MIDKINHNDNEKEKMKKIVRNDPYGKYFFRYNIMEVAEDAIWGERIMNNQIDKATYKNIVEFTINAMLDEAAKNNPLYNFDLDLQSYYDTKIKKDQILTKDEFKEIYEKVKRDRKWDYTNILLNKKIRKTIM